MHRLYHLPLSPFCRKIRLVLAEKRVDFELIEERPWEKRHDFLRLNPAGKVPVLITADGHALSESAAIVEYIEETVPEPPIPARAGPSKAISATAATIPPAIWTSRPLPRS